MSFGPTPHASPSTLGSRTPVADRPFGAPYADALHDGFGGPPQPGGPAAATAARAGAVALDPASLVVPPTPVGARTAIEALVVNDGESDVALDSLRVSNPAFATEIAGSNVVSAHGRLEIELTFAPTPPRLGPQDAVLTIELQDGARISAPITARAELPGTREPPARGAVPDAHAAPAPDHLARVWPHPSREQCTPDNRGQALVGEVRAMRVHNPGSPGEFRDPDATTLYPHDLVEVTVELPTAMAATAFGRIEDSAGLLAMRRVERRGDSLLLVAEATRLGRTFTELAILSDGEDVARLPHAPLAVVAALADADPEPNSSQRVKTTDIESALAQIRTAIDSLFGAQRDGVGVAQGDLQARRSRPKLPWYAELFALGGEAIISTFTAGVGNRLGRALGQWSAGARDLDLGKVPLVDWESAFGAGFKDSLKQHMRSRLLGSGAAAGMTVDEQWAIAQFCAAQISALDKVRLDLHGEFNDGARAYKDLEAARPGLGLSAVEAHRHALAATMEGLQTESTQSTIREWLASLARTTHGTLAAPMPADAASADAAPDGEHGVGGTDMARPGRGHLIVQLAVGDPAGAPVVESMSVAGVDGPAPAALRGSVGEQGLPIEVRLGSVVLRRNERGQVWVETHRPLAVLGGDLERHQRAYLFAKGTGRSEWASDADLRAGVDAGAERVLTELLGLPVGIR
jgi:hypothetical protein